MEEDGSLCGFIGVECLEIQVAKIFSGDYQEEMKKAYSSVSFLLYLVFFSLAAGPVPE